jgi:hypothetical protein
MPESSGNVGRWPEIRESCRERHFWITSSRIRDISRQNLGEFPVGQQIASGILHTIEKIRVSQS